MTKSMIERVRFLGFGISVFSIRELNSYIFSIIRTNNRSVIYGHSLGSFALIKRIPELYCYGDKADILLTDGRLFFYLARLSGLDIKLSMSIPQFVLHVIDLANRNNWSLYILGASSQVNNDAQAKIRKQYSGIKKIDGRDGYFVDSEESNIIAEINKFSPNILLIGVPSPRKEIFSIERKNRLNVNIIIPCGGMIDVLAEKVKLSPNWIKKLGLASLYRLFQEPRRLGTRYLYLYYRLFFIVLPITFWNVFLKRNKKFSFVNYYKINCPDFGKKR